MADKYKVYIGRDEEIYKKAIIALVDSNLLVYSRARLKSLDAIIKHYDGIRYAMHTVVWLLIGYTDETSECTRCIYTTDDYWNCLNEYKEVELEQLVSILKDGQEIQNLHRVS